MSYVEDMEKRAEHQYEDHVLVEFGEKRWLIEHPDRGMSKISVEALDYGRIIAHGNIRPVIWQGHRSRSPRSLIAWIAGSHRGYLQEKITMGFDDPDICWDFEADEAVRQLQGYIDHGDPESDIYARAIEKIRHEDPIDEVRGYIADHEVDAWEWVYKLGRVPAPRVFYAHAAVKRLDQLLRSESE